MLQSHCRTVLRESYCQSLRTPGQHVLLCLCTPRLNAPFGGPFMGYPFPRPLPSSLYQKKSRGKDFRHFAPLWFSSQHPSTPTQPSLAALQPKIHKMAGAFSWSSFSNKMISPHYCWHWVGQKVHSVLFHNILWKNLNKLFDQPNTSINPKGNHSWIFIGRTDAQAEAPILWPPDVKNWLIVNPWPAACQDSLSFTITQSLLKLMSIELVMPSNISISVVPFSSRHQSFPVSGSFQMSQFFSSGGQSIRVPTFYA